MEKAFDLKELGIRFKNAGIPLAEDLLIAATNVTLDWASESCAMKAVEQPMFAIGVPFIGVLKPAILALEDKLDGKEG